jgi:hypothetical protein
MLTSDDDFVRIIDRAAKIAERAPEKYQKEAFRNVHVFLMENIESAAGKPHDSNVKISKPKAQENVGAADIIAVKFDWSGTSVLKHKGIAQYLAILEIALNELKIDGLSAKKIQEVLFEKFRISKTPNTVSMTLMDAQGKYVDRIKENGEYIYRITRKGIDFLKEEEANF